MRVILAVIFIFAASSWLLDLIPERLTTWAMFIVLPLVVFLAFVLFDKGFLRRLIISDEKYIEKQLAKGRATKETYVVSRALSFEDRRTGCMAHFVELGDESVMVLYGQYLYEHEPIDDDPEFNQPRRFPTTEFTIVRSLKGDVPLDLRIGSRAIETKLIQEPDDYRVIADLGFRLEDGEIVKDVSFDEVEAALVARKI